jgi:hypothetical protein
MGNGGRGAKPMIVGEERSMMGAHSKLEDQVFVIMSVRTKCVLLLVKINFLYNFVSSLKT